MEPVIHLMLYCIGLVLLCGFAFLVCTLAKLADLHWRDAVVAALTIVVNESRQFIGNRRWRKR
jgi:hypothetical protein